MSQTTSSGIDIPSEGCRLVHEAAIHSIPLRLIGGIAVWVRASDEARRILGRECQDLDLASRASHSRALSNLLESIGYEPLRKFNATHGHQRLLFHAPNHAYDVDIFLDKFTMSQTIDLSQRLDVEDLTVPAAELLLTKLQVFEVNYKDISDTAMLLFDHELANEDGPQKLNILRVTALCAANWPLFTTISDNLKKVRDMLPELLPNVDHRNVVGVRIDELERCLEACPKTLKWKLRAKVGRKVRWYELPEEVEH